VAKLPAPDQLERICTGLANLDAMLSEDWESRYYSFDPKWSKGQRMASMRNGSGDDWFIVFAGGVFVKAFWHEYKREDVDAIYRGLPAKLAAQRTEGAFSMEDVTFGGFHDGKSWTLRGNAKPMKDELAMLTGDAKYYVEYAAAYFEAEVPRDAVAHVLAGKPIDAKLVARIAPDRSYRALKKELV
jgi:hypothetical protein